MELFRDLILVATVIKRKCNFCYFSVFLRNQDVVQFYHSMFTLILTAMEDYYVIRLKVLLFVPSS